jgi:hypothetical protein
MAPSWSKESAAIRVVGDRAGKAAIAGEGSNEKEYYST